MHTKLGCEAYITRNGQILLGKRGAAIFGGGTWALPGGHLEHMERADECLAREVSEEVGITVTAANLKLLSVVDDIEPLVHYIHLTFTVDIGDQEPRLMEPDECDEWRWFPLDEMPENLFPPHKKIFATIASGQIY